MATQGTMSCLYGCVLFSILCVCMNASRNLVENKDVQLDQRDVDPCKSHKVLDQGWRSVNNRKHYDENVKSHCDSGRSFPAWYRFRGNAGNRMPDKCVGSAFMCGTVTPMWLDGGHPTVADGIVSRTACAYWVRQCCRWSTSVKVKLCPAGFYVYYLPDVPRCNLGYCGEYHDLCQENNGGCSHHCSMDNTTFNAVCSCPNGFVMTSDNRTCDREKTTILPPS